MQPSEISELIAGAQLSLFEKLDYHLRGNIEPPVPKTMVPVALEAIWLDSYGFDWDETEVQLPQGSRYFGKQQASIRAIIEGHHLQPFLMQTADNQQRRESDAEKEGDNYDI